MHRFQELGGERLSGAISLSSTGKEGFLNPLNSGLKVVESVFVLWGLNLTPQGTVKTWWAVLKGHLLTIKLET